MDIKKEIGRRIKVARRASKLTLSDAVNGIEELSVSRLSNYETGERTLPVEIALKLAARLKVTPAYLLTLEENDITQYNVKDFSKYTDKLNNEQSQRLEELISYFVVLNDEHQKDILKQAGNLHSLQSRLNQIMRRRDKPKVLKDDIHESGRKKA